jgi:molecular chaperone DnaK
MPIVQRYIEQLLNKKVERGVDPMEAVALGAAVQAGVLTGEVKDIVLLDVTPLSLSIETMGGIATKIIERNTTIPIKKSQIFTTADDNQPSVDIKVVQGERAMAKDNIELGRFTLTGIPPARRGTPQIEVTFDIDSNGILHVTAKDKGTGKEQKMDIVAPHKMSKDEIDKKINESQAHEDEDKKLRDQVETKNSAESLVYSTSRTLEDYKDKIPSEIKLKVESAQKELEEVLKGEDYTAIKEKYDALVKVVQDIGASIYKDDKGQPGPQDGPGPGPGGDNNVTDADFKVNK